MTLPTVPTAAKIHTITLSDDVVVTFQLAAIPGKRYQEILDDHRDEEGRATNEACYIDIVTEGVHATYSNIESTPTPFTQADATEIFETWPEWARWEIFTVCVVYSTKGPAADPFVKSGPNENAAP